MTEIIIKKVEMPLVELRRFTKHYVGLNGKKWTVKDNENEIYTGSFEEASLICYNKNKLHYLTQKQQIIDCYNDAYQDPLIYSEDVGKKYYDETYNNDTLNREK